MKCISCTIEINPQWTHAIDMNVCPFCGKYIMEEQLKNLFSTLRTTMENLETYQEQLNDWMLSNYNYIKTDLIPVQKIEINSVVEEKNLSVINVKENPDTDESVVIEKIQSEEKTNDFFKRAETVRPKIDGFNTVSEKTQHLKSLVQQIKTQGSVSIDEDGTESIIPSQMMKNNLIANDFNDEDGGGSIDFDSNSGDEEIPKFVMEMAKGAKGGNNNAADMLKMQQQRDKLKSSRENFESGANRGGRGGGFSRSG